MVQGVLWASKTLGKMNYDLPPSFGIINLDLRQNKWIYVYTDGQTAREVDADCVF